MACPSSTSKIENTKGNRAAKGDRTLAYVQELLEISPAILKLAAPFADSVQPHHWISTPEGDEGSEWCPACGLAKVKELLAEDPDHAGDYFLDGGWRTDRSEEHTSELQSLMRTSSAVFCLK